MHDYFDIILRNPPTTYIIFVLGILRMAPIVVLAPFLGGKLLPPVAKMLFAVCVVSMILPFLVVNTGQKHLLFGPDIIILAFKETFVGLVLGFFVSVPFWIAQSAGTIIDHQRGASSLTITDPAMGTQVSPIGLFYNYSLIALFYAWGGVYAFFDIVLDSYKIVRPEELIDASFFASKSLFIENIMTVGGKIFAMSVQFASPSLLAILMADMFLGIANRLAPQVQITFLGLPLKSWLGLLLLLTSMAIVWGVLSDFSKEWVDFIGNMVRYMQPNEFDDIPS